MSKTKAEKLTEKEKEQQRLVIPFDEAKQFLTNINAMLDSSEIFKNWEIKPSSVILKSNALKMQFTLKDTAIAQIIESMDKGQKKLKDFLDPDKIHEEELEVEQ